MLSETAAQANAFLDASFTREVGWKPSRPQSRLYRWGVIRNLLSDLNAQEILEALTAPDTLTAPQLLQQTSLNAKTPSQKSGFPHLHGKLPLQDGAYLCEYFSMDALCESNPMYRLYDNAQIVWNSNTSLTAARRHKVARSVPGKNTKATAPNFTNTVSPPTTPRRTLSAPDGKQNGKSKKQMVLYHLSYAAATKNVAPVPQACHTEPGQGLPSRCSAACNASLSAPNLSSDFPSSSPYPWTIYQPGRPCGHFCPSLHGL